MKSVGGITFRRPWLILCEGEADMAFFTRLLDAHQIDDFQVAFPGREGDNTGGRGKFGRWLKQAREAGSTFDDTVRAVLVVSDNDADPPKSFSELQSDLRRADGFGVPDREQTVARSPGFPDVVALMVPIGEPGSIETLCVRASYEKWPIQGPLDAFVGATDAAHWEIGKQSKMRMQAILAATCAPKPDVSFLRHWQQNPIHHVPLTSPEFSPIVAFLRGFGALLAVP